MTTPVYERAGRLLQYLAQQSKQLGDLVRLDQDMPMAMAVSESISEDEVGYLGAFLQQRGWIEHGPVATAAGGYILQRATVTVYGYSRIAELATNPDSNQCFVALWFNDSMNAPYDKGIAPAIKAAGYKPMRIDRNDKENSLNRIDDQIIAEIRRSRFLVADFTHGNDGVRGSVYYEAGFAHGLDIPVIFTCKQDADLHFDVNHYPFIMWKDTDYPGLRQQLRNRILAVIGGG